jgi:hypothetical protein
MSSSARRSPTSSPDLSIAGGSCLRSATRSSG